LGIGDWGLGIGDWGLGPIPNPHRIYLIDSIVIIFNLNYIFNRLYLIFLIKLNNEKI